MMRIDLHSHSTASDGTFSPSELIGLARQADIDTFAITDHDTMAGYMAVMDSVPELSLIAGVEISASHTLMGGYGKNQALDKIIHVVGLDIRQVARMQAALLKIQESRADRGYKMVVKIAQRFDIDYRLLWERCLDKVAGNALTLGRAHIAGAMVELGLIKTYQEAFDKYLGDGKLFYVPIETWTMSYAIDMIHQCGGYAVLAHPTRYNLSATRIRRLIEEFAALGGDACELPSHDEPISIRQMIDRAIYQNGLMVSVGSDFHGTTMPWRKLGQVAKLSETQTGIWTKFS